jgi:hypothetical protein
VTTQVQGLYSGSNNGFLLSDQTESAAAGPQQEYMSREDPDDPLYLTVTWA